MGVRGELGPHRRLTPIALSVVCVSAALCIVAKRCKAGQYRKRIGMWDEISFGMLPFSIPYVHPNLANGRGSNWGVLDWHNSRPLNSFVVPPTPNLGVSKNSPFKLRVVCCGQTVQDRPTVYIVCIEVEYECRDEIFTISDCAIDESML